MEKREEKKKKMAGRRMGTRFGLRAWMGTPAARKKSLKE
jgi:hypothetical protein